MRVIGYVRTSTVDQEAGATAQAKEIRRTCKARKALALVTIVEEHVSGASLERPGLQAAIEELRAGRADGLMVTKLDRLSRSTRDAAELFKVFADNGWELIVLDPAVDTSTPWGKALASFVAVMAELERDLISERTKAALAVRKAQGVRLGQEPMIPDEVIDHMRELRGPAHRPRMTYQEIADRLTLEGVPTARGGAIWRKSTVRDALVRVARSEHVLT